MYEVFVNADIKMVLGATHVWHDVNKSKVLAFCNDTCNVPVSEAEIQSTPSESACSTILGEKTFLPDPSLYPPTRYNSLCPLLQ